MKLLEINHVDLCYRGFRALSGINLTIAKGERVGILGQNGAGKTSLIACLLGLVRISRGRRFALGTPLPKRSSRLLSVAGNQLGTPSFYDRLTCRDHLQLAEKLTKYRNQGMASSVLSLVDGFGLAPHLDKRMGECSSGIRKRVAISIAIALADDILILDDPTAELDARSGRILKDTLTGAKKSEQTLIIAAHSVPFIQNLVDRVIVIESGAVIYDGSLETFNKLLGDVFELQVDGEFDFSEIDRNRPTSVNYLVPLDEGTALASVQPGRIAEFLSYLGACNVQVRSLTPQPLGSKELRDRLRTQPNTPNREEKQSAEEDTDAGAAGHTRTERLHSVGQTSFPRRFLISALWEGKLLSKGNLKWLLPLTLLLSGIFGLIGSVSFDERILGQEVSLSSLLGRLISVQCVVGSLIICIASTLAGCRDYIGNRHRFLFSLPFSGGDLFFGKLIVWCVILVVYLILSILVISVALIVGVHLAFSVPWAPEIGGLSVGFFIQEGLEVLPVIFLAMGCIGAFFLGVGLVVRNLATALILNIAMLSLSLMTMVSLDKTIMPASRAISASCSFIMSLADGMVPLLPESVFRDIVGGGIIALVVLVLGYVRFVRKAW